MAKLDLAKLNDFAWQFFKMGVAVSTERSYHTEQASYQPNLLSVGEGQGSVPTCELVLCQFVSFLAKEGLKHCTIKAYLSAVRFLHTEQEVGNPFKPTLYLLDYVLKGVKVVRVTKGRSDKGKSSNIPQPVEEDQGSRETLATDPDVVTLWAACCLAFFGFLKSGRCCFLATKHTNPPFT